MKRILALDTATEALSVAVLVNGEAFAEFQEVGRFHSRELVPMIRRVMQAAGLRMGELDALICGVGPGSFVGVRVGVSFAKGVATARGIPVAAASSLDLIAAGMSGTGHVGELASVALDARMGEVYTRNYRRSPQGLLLGESAPRVCKPEQLLSKLVPETSRRLAGRGFVAYPQLQAGIGQYLPGVDELPDIAHAGALLTAEQLDWLEPSQLEPVYLRNKVALTLLERA